MYNLLHRMLMMVNEFCSKPYEIVRGSHLSKISAKDLPGVVKRIADPCIIKDVSSEMIDIFHY